MADSLFDPFGVLPGLDIVVESWDDLRSESAGTTVAPFGRPDPIVITSMLVSVGIHVAILFGIGKPAARPAAAPAEEHLIALIAMPQLKDLLAAPSVKLDAESVAALDKASA